MVKSKFKHNKIFPDPLLMIVSGRSGIGKTYATFKLLTEDDYLDYDNLYIYTSTPNQPFYIFLKGLEIISKADLRNLFKKYEENENLQDYPIEDLLKEYMEKYNLTNNETGIKVYISDNKSTFNVKNLNKSKKNLMVFDDCILEKDQTLQKEFYIKGRHHNCHSIYQTQSYYDTPNEIRKNATCFIFFETANAKDLIQMPQSILHRKENSEFKQLLKNAWSQDYGHLYVNPSNRIETCHLNLFF